MPRNTRKFRGGVKRRVKAAGKKKVTFKSASALAMNNSRAPSIEIKSDADVKKAFDLMKKHPLTVVLVYANWCPHCHTFMEKWNKYKKLPNRNSPMVKFEQAFIKKMMPHIQTKDGAPMSIDGFPTVFMTMNSNATGANTGSSQNVGIIVEDPRNEEAMSELLTNSAEKVTAMPVATAVPATIVEPSVVNSMSMPTLGTTAVNASMFEESIQGSQQSRRGTPYPRNSNMNVEESTGASASESASRSNSGPPRKKARTAKITRQIATAIRSASNAAKSASASAQRMREIGSEELSASDRGSFVSRPPPEGMSGGGCTGPSGLCQLSGGGGYNRGNSLLAQLGGYVNHSK